MHFTHIISLHPQAGRYFTPTCSEESRFRGPMACLGQEVFSDLAPGSHSPGLAEYGARTLARHIAVSTKNRGGSGRGCVFCAVLGLQDPQAQRREGAPTPAGAERLQTGASWAAAGCFGFHFPREKAYPFLTGHISMAARCPDWEGRDLEGTGLQLVRSFTQLYVLVFSSHF